MTKTETANLYEAKARLSKFCQLAADGCDVVITRHGQPWVRITALKPQKREVRFGILKDEVHISEGFDDPLPDDQQGSFEGDSAPS